MSLQDIFSDVHVKGVAADQAAAKAVQDAEATEAAAAELRECAVRSASSNIAARKAAEEFEQAVKLAVNRVAVSRDIR